MNTFITPNLYRFEDSCAVYVLRWADEAVLIDFGSGAVLDCLPALGIKRISAVLMTHYHRDQGQGLQRAADFGAHIYVPEAEQDLFRDVDRSWMERPLDNNYNVSQDRFALLESVPEVELLKDYSLMQFGGPMFSVLPTPGHTPGSSSLLVEIDGRRVAFTGDLISAPGQVWSLAAMQWSYNGAEGAPATVASLLDLKRRQVEMLLPSHGDPIADPGPAIDLLVERLGELLNERQENGRLFDLLAEPYQPLTPHLLRNRTSESISYVLLSASGKALLIDYGYDFMSGQAPNAGRATRRPWLYTLPDLKQKYGVSQIEAAIPTHYHDDHLAGFNLLRRVEGTQVWAAESFASILENPAQYDLPCLWYDPIPVDRCLPLEQPIRWEEYELSLYPLPGHTRHAVAISVDVDGKRVLFTGDQYQEAQGRKWNYVYRNDFTPGDYPASARLCLQLKPDLILPGHWDPLWVQPGYLEAQVEQAGRLQQLHNQLLPVETFNGGAEGYLARLHPYRRTALPKQLLEYEIVLTNPYAWDVEACLHLALPVGWELVEPISGEASLRLPSRQKNTPAKMKFSVRAGEQISPRTRLAVDISTPERQWGQQAEALVDPAPAKRYPGQLAVPVLEADFPDPDAIRLADASSPTGFRYYAYATNGRGIHVRTAVTTDLQHWDILPDALPQLPAWAMPAGPWTWSPDVLPIGEGYVMYYVTRFADGQKGMQVIGSAISDRPEGPFRPDHSRPLICQSSEGGSIDPSAFVDEDGSRYLVWKNDGNACARPTWIYLQRLSADGLSLEGERLRLFNNDRAWEGQVVEGPVLWKQAGKYYLFYAANDFTRPSYCICCAVADRITGPYQKMSQPFLSSSLGLTGPGGPDICLSPTGETMMLFHAWAAGRRRCLHTARLEWQGGLPRLAL